MSQTIKRQTWKQVAISLTLLLAGFAYLYPSITNPLNQYDEGLVAVYASAILDGEIPYRDFWTVYTPGQYYVVAALFKIFGTSIAVMRIYDIVLRSFVAFATYLLACKLSNRWLAAIPWAIALTRLEAPGIGFGNSFGWPILPALVLYLFGFYAVWRSFEDPRWLWFAGFLAGLGGLFRQDFLLYGAISQAVVIFGYAYSRSGHYDSKFRRFQLGMYSLLPYGTALAGVLAPAVIYFLWKVPLEDLKKDLVVYPLFIFPEQRSLPYPPLAWTNFTFYFFFIVFALAAILVYKVLRNPDEGSELGRVWAWSVASMILFGVLGFNQARVRSEILHIVVSFIPAIVLLPALITGFRVLFPSSTIPVSLAVSITSLILSVPLFYTYSKTPQTAGSESILERASGVSVNQDQLRIAEFLKANTEPGDLLYSGLGRHDRIFVNDVMLYFLADLRPASRYVDLNPGQATTASVQREICQDLDINDVTFVVIWKGADNFYEPNASIESSGIKILDSCIASHYSLVYSAGQYLVLQRNV